MSKNSEKCSALKRLVVSNCKTGAGLSKNIYIRVRRHAYREMHIGALHFIPIQLIQQSLQLAAIECYWPWPEVTKVSNYHFLNFCQQFIFLFEQLSINTFNMHKTIFDHFQQRWNRSKFRNLQAFAIYSQRQWASNGFFFS